MIMEKFEIKINPQDIFKGGQALWLIQIKERFYNGRWRLIILGLTSIIFLFYFPLISIILIGGFLLIVFIDYFLNFVEYRKLCNEHSKEQSEKYFLQ